MKKLLVPPTPVERYFSLHYAINFAKRTIPETPRDSANPESKPTGLDVCVARHHNGLCLLCLSPRHPIVANAMKVTRINYRVPFQEVRGKRKKGGIVVEMRTRLCTLTCESGEVFTVQSGVKGTVVEYNEAAQKDTSLVVGEPLRDGYLAVILPFSSQIRTSVDQLMSANMYELHFQHLEKS